MYRIRNQRQRVPGVAKDQLGNDERRIERGADSEGAAEMIRRLCPAWCGREMIVVVPWRRDAHSARLTSRRLI